MTTLYDIATRWAERGAKPDLAERNLRNCNIIADGDTIYSYGRHFPIAEIYRHANGRARLILLNGDRYSVSTTGHQAAVRHACDTILPDVPAITVPFSALRAAGINHASILPLDVHNSGYQYSVHVSDEPPASAEPHPMHNVRCGRGYIDGGNHRAHSMFGDSTGVVLAIYTEGEWQAVQQGDDGRYTWHTLRHWLGDSLFAARANGRRKRVKFLSSFDRNERIRLYFLCELPATSAIDIDGALQALKPDAVVLAEGMGRGCERQGDIFAVPMTGLTSSHLIANGGIITRRSDAMKGIRAARSVSLLGTSHTATHVCTTLDGTQYARGTMYHDPSLMGENRERDHARRKMSDGKAWHLIVKNTVPIQ